MAEHGPSVDIPSEDELWDKSKASGLTKTIVCLQATWFLAQFISRLALGLSVSILELNTAAHALCALLIYILWWNKPLQVEQPIFIRGRNQNQFFAVLWALSEISDKVLKKESELVSTQEPTQEPSKELNRKRAFQGQSTLKSFNHDQDVASGTLYKPLSAPCPTLNGPDTDQTFPMRCLPRDNISAQDQNLWELASAGWDNHVTGLRSLSSSSIKVRRVKNWPAGLNIMESLFGIPGLAHVTNSSFKDLDNYFFGAFAIAGLLFGAIYMIAWNGPFHSPVERLLWRISAIAIMASSLELMVMTSVFKMWWRWAMKWTRRLTDWAVGKEGFKRIWLVVHSIYARATLILYILARAYLIIEAFVSLPYLPGSAFQQPRWSHYFPHIT